MLESIKTGTSPTDTAVKTTTYTYTSRGQRATETKPNNNKVTYRWIEDGLMRSQTETQDLGGKLVSSHALAYNLDGQQSTDVSKVQNADSPTAYLSQTASLVYTEDNRLRWITKSGANPGAMEAYSYDAAGNTTWQQQGTTNTFYKNDRNRLLCAGTTQTDPCAGSPAVYNYDPFGRLDTITAGDKTVERYGYDGFDRMVSDRKYDPATGASKSSQTSVFDPLDRTVSKSTAVGTGAAKTTTGPADRRSLAEQARSVDRTGRAASEQLRRSVRRALSGSLRQQDADPAGGARAGGGVLQV
jgi:YD repeat-containing protein